MLKDFLLWCYNVTVPRMLKIDYILIYKIVYLHSYIVRNFYRKIINLFTCCEKHLSIGEICNQSKLKLKALERWSQAL